MALVNNITTAATAYQTAADALAALPTQDNAGAAAAHVTLSQARKALLLIIDAADFEAHQTLAVKR